MGPVVPGVNVSARCAFEKDLQVVPTSAAAQRRAIKARLCGGDAPFTAITGAPRTLPFTLSVNNKTQREATGRK